MTIKDDKEKLQEQILKLILDFENKHGAKIGERLYYEKRAPFFRNPPTVNICVRV